MNKRVVVLGGGVAGTRVANQLRKRRDDISITVVDSHGDHLYQPSYLYLPFGLTYPSVHDERTLLKKGIELVIERVSSIDLPRREVRLENGGGVPYDVLVIATGSRLDHHAIPGLFEAGYHFHCRSGAERLREALMLFEGGKVVVGACRLPYKCPPSPHEFTLLLDEWLVRHRLRSRTEIYFVYPLPRVFSQDPVADAAEELFSKRGIRGVTSFITTSVDGARHELRSQDGRTLPFDLLVLVPPHVGAPFLAESGLVGADNWVTVDKETLRAAEGVYALGDAAALPVPKSGAAAHFQSEVVAKNVLAELEGRPPETRYDGHVQCFFEVGGYKAMKIEFTYAHPPQASPAERDDPPQEDPSQPLLLRSCSAGVARRDVATGPVLAERCRNILVATCEPK